MTNIKCKCGAVEIALKPNANGTRVQCYCESCRGFAKVMNAGEQFLNPKGGVEIYQTTPDEVEILQGKENIAASSIKDGGLVRWHCNKCQTPLTNSMPKSGVPFMGIVLPVDMHLPKASELGNKIKAIHQYHARPNNDGSGKNNQGFHHIIWGMFSRVMTKLLTGKARKSDWHEGKDWIAKARVLPKSERDALYESAKTL